MNDMTYEEWASKYRLMPNHVTNHSGSYSYETYGEELEYILLQDDKHVWTELDGDNGVYIVNGYHLVNRINYYLTNVPWQEDDDICITICEYVTCSCYNEETEDGDPNCDMCQGFGSYTDWKD